MKAVVDLGSNTVKYAVGRMMRGVLEVTEKKSWVTRLGKGVGTTGALADASVADTVSALEKMRDRFAECGISAARVVATSAVRDARNPETLRTAVKRLLGRELDIISGLEEARLSFLGASAASQSVYGARVPIIIDLGGASTEVGVPEPKLIAHSFQAGALRCHEALGLGDMPVSDGVWDAAKRSLNRFFPREQLDLILTAAADKAPLLAVGGTLVVAARLAGGVTVGGAGLEVSAQGLNDLSERVRKLSLTERLAVPGMPAGRADTLPSGTLILLHIMAAF